MPRFLSHHQMPCWSPTDMVVSCRKGMVSQLFSESGKPLQGLAFVLGQHFQLIAIPYGQVLAPKSLFSCSDSLLVCHSFRGSMYNVGSLALQCGKHKRSFYTWCPFMVRCYSIYLFLVGLHLGLLTFPGWPPSFPNRSPSLLSGPSSPFNQHLSRPSSFLDRCSSLLSKQGLCRF
jgi:hypothetical protein